MNPTRRSLFGLIAGSVAAPIAAKADAPNPAPVPDAWKYDPVKMSGGGGGVYATTCTADVSACGHRFIITIGD